MSVDARAWSTHGTVIDEAIIPSAGRLLLYLAFWSSLMVKSKTDTDVDSLPEPTIWARAVLLGTAVFGVTLSDRTLNATNVDAFGQKVRDAAKPLAPVAWALLQALEARITGAGGNVECDRMRTARSANALCEHVAKAPAPVIVELLAHARLDTSSSAVQASLTTGNQALATLEDTTVTNTLKRLVQLERTDLSASKYLREARQVLQQDELRRSLQVELRMVIGAAEAYLSTGKQSLLSAGAFDTTQDLDFSTPAPPPVFGKIAAPVDVVIAKKRSTAPPPPSQPRAKKEFVKKTTDLKTLASEDTPILARVSVERKATRLSRAEARAMLDEVYKEAVERIEQTRAPMLVSVTLTYDVTRDE